MICWDSPHFSIDGQRFIPLVYEGSPDPDSVPSGFNTVCIRLDGRLDSALDWTEAITQARKLIEQSDRKLLILWDLDLGLTNGLRCAISDQAQYQALCLSIDHFLNAVWPQFHTHTLGVILYRGNLTFADQFPWDFGQRDNFERWCSKIPGATINTQWAQHVYCRNALASYLGMLKDRLSAAVEAFLLLDGSLVNSPIQQELLWSSEVFARFHLVRKGARHTKGGMTWNGVQTSMGAIAIRLPEVIDAEEVRIGLCLPYGDAELCLDGSLDSALTHLLQCRIPLRIIPEVQLTAQWDQLDCLIVDASAITASGKRMLQGFCAAGGRVVRPQEVDDLFLLQ